EYCRTQRRPYILEARVSRLYGHSSSSGALRVKNERDCLDILERRLRDAGILEQTEIDQIHADADAETEAALEQASSEPSPTKEDVYLHTYAPSEVDVVYPGDYTGLPT